MNTYEIQVFDATTEDMDNIAKTLSNASIGFTYDATSFFVEIDPTNDTINKAVRTINDLGFGTDEDKQDNTMYTSEDSKQLFTDLQNAIQRMESASRKVSALRDIIANIKAIRVRTMEKKHTSIFTAQDLHGFLGKAQALRQNTITLNTAEDNLRKALDQFYAMRETLANLIRDNGLCGLWVVNLQQTKRYKCLTNGEFEVEYI